MQEIVFYLETEADTLTPEEEAREARMDEACEVLDRLMPDDPEAADALLTIILRVGNELVGLEA